MFLAYMSLVAAGVRLPEIILIFVGPGGEGKTLLLCDLMRAVWCSGRAVAPPSILQTAEEFRKQGHLYRGMRWVSVGESKNAKRIEGDVFKIFVSGGSLFLRKNREAETHMADWAYCGKSWAMNPDDVPHAPSALDAAYSRRIRCVRMRAKFTATASEVDQRGGVYQKDDTLKDWIGGGEATSAFWTTVLMPFIRKFTDQECGEKIFRSTQAAQEDTKWLLRKMARRQFPGDQRWPNPSTSPGRQET